MARSKGGMQMSSEYYWSQAHAQGRVDDRRGEEESLLELRPDGPRDPAATPGDELELLHRYLPKGFALYAFGVARRVREGASQRTIELAAALRPGQAQAGEVCFTGRPADEGYDQTAVDVGGSPELEKLEREIAARKKQK